MTSLRAPASLRWWTLAIVAVGTFMLMLDLSVVAIALPDIRTSLQASFMQLQWVFDAYALTLAVVLVTAGSIADRNGRKLLFQFGLVVFTVASLACGVANDIAVLNVSRGVQGVGAAILFAVGPALLGHEFHGKQRAVAFGVFGAAAGLAVACGPLIGGMLTSGPGWRWIFYINVPIGVLALIAAHFRLRESCRPQATAPDLAGMVLLTMSLAAIVLAIIRGNTEGWFSISEVTLYAVGAAALVAFVLVERRIGDGAMFPLAMFGNPTFVGISLVALIANGAGLPSIFIETSFMQNVLGYSAWDAGLRFQPLTLAIFVFGAFGGGMIGKIPFRVLMGLACSFLGVGLLLTQLADANSSWTALIPSLIVTGAGMGLFNPTRAALAIGVTEPAKAGVASGINETFQQIGIALGIAGIGAFFAHSVTEEFVGSAAGRALGASAQDAGAAIGAGAIDSTGTASGPLQQQVIAAGRTAFTNGFHSAMVVCAVFAILAALIAVFMLRTKDLHSSALSLVPPEDDLDAELAQLSGSVGGATRR
jgi:EmrB/QacA subfamily drug resistance transporter